jgi:DNA helicase II / ATP-dependent DNA helicase PcrA
MLALAEAQERAVQHREGPLLLAGAPGTGNTETIARRFARLVEDGVAPERILVLSAHRATAERLLARIEALLNRPYEELWIGTWPNLCERLLREHAVAAGLDPFFEVLGRAERLAVLLDRLDDLPLRHHDIRGNPAGLLARLLERIDELKAGSEPPEPELAEFCAAHDRVLSDSRNLDQGDVFLVLNKLLDERPDVRAEIASRFPHVMVDEYEDAGPAQRAILISFSSESSDHV